jgi:hypothetical protein
VVVEASSESNGQAVVATDGFDLIIACTPPPGYSSNAMSFMSSTDMAIVVATRRRSRSRDARWATELLRHTGVRIAGAILVDRKGSRQSSPAHLAPVLPGADEGDRDSVLADGSEGPNPGRRPSMDSDELPNTPSVEKRVSSTGNRDLDRKGAPHPG